jgi:hypothetical protein
LKRWMLILSPRSAFGKSDPALRWVFLSEDSAGQCARELRSEHRGLFEVVERESGGGDADAR